jgi:hypothetical protein
MSSFDLNINNYNVSELETLLDIQKPYNLSDVSVKCKQFKEKVISGDSMPISNKLEIAEFLDQASQKIISNIMKITGSLEKQENIFPKTFESFKNTIIPSNGNAMLIEPASVRAGLESKPWEGRLIDNPDQPPGIINPINVRTIKKTVNVDTRFRPNYYNTMSTNFTMTLPLRVKQVVSMRIASIELPITWYVVSKASGNSFYKIEWDWDPVTKTFSKEGVVTIPDGNYECFWQDTTHATDLASTINSFMHSLDPTDTKLQDIIYNVDRTSGKSVFAWNATGATPPEPFRITFAIDEDGNDDFETVLQFRLGWLLGFRVGTYEGNSIVSEGICYMKGPRYAFISINDFNNSVNSYLVSAFASSILQKDIIARINLTYIQQNQGVYQSGQDDGLSTQINRQRSYFGPVDIERLEIKLLDEYGRIIDLNNMDWSVALTMECLYEN